MSVDEDVPPREPSGRFARRNEAGERTTSRHDMTWLQENFGEVYLTVILAIILFVVIRWYATRASKADVRELDRRLVVLEGAA